jgi:hypothetical protein
MKNFTMLVGTAVSAGLGRRCLQMKCVLVFGAVLVMATAGSAQSKFSGTQQCAKPDPVYTVPVGDRPDHMMSLIKDKCTWTGAEIGGVKLTDEEDTIVSDSSGNRARDRGIGVATLADGDKAFVQFQGSGTLKNNMPVDGQGTWSFTGGTGKLKALKGKGTYKGKWNPDGTSTFEIEGEYQLTTATTGK